MKITVKAEECKGKDLRPGELFSTVGPEYWEAAMDRLSVGERVYIRTNAQHDQNDGETPIYRITIMESNT